jgi:hypothetical protein
VTEVTGTTGTDGGDVYNNYPENTQTLNIIPTQADIAINATESSTINIEGTFTIRINNGRQLTYPKSYFHMIEAAFNIESGTLTITTEGTFTIYTDDGTQPFTFSVSYIPEVTEIAREYMEKVKTLTDEFEEAIINDISLEEKLNNNIPLGMKTEVDIMHGQTIDKIIE